MGRKQNQLVVEFFDRGLKLNNGSNRYVQTCKACGETFPKGRIETLLSHMNKRCRSISSAERRRVLSQQQESSEFRASINAAVTGPRSIFNRTQHQHARKLRVGGRRKFTGLEALAEASRQIEQPSESETSAERDDFIDPNLEGISMYERLVYNHPRDHLGVAFSQSMNNASQSLHISPTSLYPHENPLAIASTAENFIQVPMSAASGDSLKTFTGKGAAANAALAMESSSQTLNPPDSDYLPPLAKSEDTSSERQPLVETTTKTLVRPRSIAIHATGAPKTVSLNHVGTQGPTLKVRRRFTDFRRQEIQKIRQKGACIRCRMLRKTCSGDSPCKTCAAVVSARVWKLDCIRTNISKEFDLYFTNLHAVLATNITNAALSQLDSSFFPCSIEVSYDIDYEFAMKDAALAVFPMELNLDPGRAMALHENNHSRGIQLSGERKYISTGQLQQYVEIMGPIFMSKERSAFMRSTLLVAMKTSLNNKEKLLARVLELWTLTQIIVSEMHLRLWLLPPPGTRNPGTRTPARQSGPMNETDYPQMYILAHAQVQAAAETLASVLSKSVMNELERCLERREKCQGLETLLIGVILLACVEKMSWYFMTFNSPRRCAKWPLEIPLDLYSQQGDNFSDFLSKLFKMRKIVLKAHPNLETGILEANDKDDALLTEWLDTVRLTKEHLKARQAAKFDHNDIYSLELKFSSRILLPME